MNEAATFKPWEKWIGALLLGLFVLAGVLSIIMPERFKPHEPEPQAVEAEVRNIGPAPTVRKGPKAILRGELVSTWIVSDAGDATYLGTYAEAGVYNGLPYYSSGSRYLYNTGADFWQLSPVLGDPTGPLNAYYTATGLPGNPWSVDMAGTAPAPTVTEQVPDPVTLWQYDYSAAWSAPSPTGGPCIAPCRATIGGTAYIVLAEQGGMFHLYDPSADTWAEADYGAALFASGQYDPTQGAGLFDAGDGTHVWACSGSWGTDYDLTWRKFALTPGGAASLVSAETYGPWGAAAHASNAVQTASNSYRFIQLFNLGGTSVIAQLRAYVSGSSPVQVWGSGVSVLPSGYQAVLYSVAGRYYGDHHLFTHDGSLYWMFHVTDTSGNHYIRPYLVTDAGMTALTPFAIASTDCYQTWGYYSDVSRYVGDIGSGGSPSAQVDPAGAFWTPAGGGATRAPFPIGRVTRRWYLDGSPLLVVGWAADDADALKPFVMNIEPITLASTAATSYGAGLRVASARTSSYGVDEGSLTDVSSDRATSYGAGLQVTGAAAASYGAGMAVTSVAASSYGADLAAPSSAPHAVRAQVHWVRGRVV